MLTSDSPRRTVARPYSYAVVRELEIREKRNYDLFGYTPSNMRRAGIEDIISPETRQRMNSLERACRVADLLGDSVARIVARADWVDGYNAHLTDGHYSSIPCRCPCNSWGSAPMGSLPEDVVGVRSLHLLPLLRTSPVDTVMTKLAFTVRAAQVAVIQGLSQWDLGYLSWLTEIAGAWYTCSVPKHPSDPDHLEKRTAFQECVLRRGASLSMWAFCAEDEDWVRQLDDVSGTRSTCKRQVEDAVKVVLWELFLWETGHGADQVPLDKASPPVEDPALALLMGAFDREVEGGGEKDQDGPGDGDRDGLGDEDQDGPSDEGDKTISAMQPGLQMTTVRTLSKKADPKVLQGWEKNFIPWMVPNYVPIVY